MSHGVAPALYAESGKVRPCGLDQPDLEQREKDRRVAFLASLLEAYLETLASPNEALTFELRHNRCAVCGETLADRGWTKGTA